MGQYCESEIKEDWIALMILETSVSLNVLFHSPGIAMYVSCSVASDSLCPCGHCPARLICLWNSPGNSAMGCHFLLQGIAWFKCLKSVQKFNHFKNRLPRSDNFVSHPPFVSHQVKGWWKYQIIPTYKFSSVQFSRSAVSNTATPWTTACHVSLSIINSRSPPKPVSIESMMPSNHLILCCPLLLLPPIFISIRVFTNESALHIRWPLYWSFSFKISPSDEHPGLIFRTGWTFLQSEGLSRVFSNITVQKHQFFSTKPSL